GIIPGDEERAHFPHRATAQPACPVGQASRYIRAPRAALRAFRPGRGWQTLQPFASGDLRHAEGGPQHPPSDIGPIHPSCESCRCRARVFPPDPCRHEPWRLPRCEAVEYQGALRGSRRLTEGTKLTEEGASLVRLRELRFVPDTAPLADAAELPLDGLSLATEPLLAPRAVSDLPHRCLRSTAPPASPPRACRRNSVWLAIFARALPGRPRSAQAQGSPAGMGTVGGYRQESLAW